MRVSISQDDFEIWSKHVLTFLFSEFEIDDEAQSENGTVITNQPTSCAAAFNSTNTNGIFTSAATTPNNRKSRTTSTLKSSTNLTSRSNGNYLANGAACTSKRNGRATAGTLSKRGDLIQGDDADPSDYGSRRSFSLVRFPIYCFWLGRWLCTNLWDTALFPIWRAISNQSWTGAKMTKMVAQDDLSVSGDGSLLGEL
jgi:hypothetical protein